MTFPRFSAGLPAVLCLVLATGCRSVKDYRRDADRAAASAIERLQMRELGKSEPLVIESTADTLRRQLLESQNLPVTALSSLGIHALPKDKIWDPELHLQGDTSHGVRLDLSEPLRPSLLDALQISARNSREYQAAKESVFQAALAFDLEQDRYSNTFGALLAGTLESDWDGDRRETGGRVSGTGSVSRRFKNGAELSSRLAVDLAKLLTRDRASSFGILADTTVTIPLLRGAGQDIAAEGLTQAERNVMYAILEFERFKKTFAVRVARDYLAVLRQFQRVDNERENYKRLIASRRRARRLADAGRMPEFQHDQAIQDELRARNRWIQAQQDYASALDSFKLLLGLPPDARLSLDLDELERLRQLVAPVAQGGMPAGEEHVPAADIPVELPEPSRESAGPLEIEPDLAVRLALEHRQDLKVASGRIQDAQRKVYVAMDALRAEVTLLGRAEVGERRSVGSARADNVKLDARAVYYSALLNVDLPIERTRERNEYRLRLMALESAVRDLQRLEDTVKLAVLDRLRSLLEARESLQIQTKAVTLAEKRIHSTDLFLQAGRAQIRDVLDAQDDLLTAQNSLSAAAVNYRIAELELQRDMGLLEVAEDGLWREFRPEENDRE